MHVVVVGGGLAGLVAARRLAAAGADVELFEADERVGGRVRSRTVEGFTLDRGFQVLFAAAPAVRRELDLEALALRSFAPGVTIARPNHRSTLADPTRDPSALLPTLFNRDVTIGDKIRLYGLARELRARDPADLLAPRQSAAGRADDDGPASAESTIRECLEDRGFSGAFAESFAEPFLGGITLDRSLGTSSLVVEYTVAMLARGEVAVPAEGMGAIPAQLHDRAEAAGATIRTGKRVTDLQVDARGDDAAPTVVAGNERVFPDAVVVATDPATAGELTGVEAPTRGRGCVTVHCSIPAHQRLDTGSRILLNAAADRPNTVAPTSAAAPEYAPEDRELLTATFLGEQDADDAALGETVRETMDAWYPENHFGDLEVLAVDRVPFAQVAQPPGFREHLPDVDDPDGNVLLAGDYTRWSSIQGALESGKRASDAVLETVD